MLQNDTATISVSNRDHIYHLGVAVWRAKAASGGLEALPFDRSTTKADAEIFYGPFYGRAEF